MNSLKRNLMEWAIRKFGENDTDDLFNIREEMLVTKNPKLNIKKIVVFVKKRIGVKKDWLRKEVVDRWKKELKEIIGEHLKIDLSSTEGQEVKYLAGIQKVENDRKQYIENPAINIYNYQFNLEIFKEINIKEKSNVGAKLRISKGTRV